MKIISVSLLAIGVLLTLGGLFAAPRELKVLVSSWEWHDSNVHASGFVAREPAGTRIYWEELGKADGPPVIVLHAGLCAIPVMVRISTQ